jgi:trigger factor
MQVSVEQTSELSRKMTVNIPEEVIATKVSERLKSLAREVKIAGFRPGKVPAAVIKQRYAGKARGEVINEVVQSSYYDALKQQDLNPAGYPHISVISDTEGLSFAADFEVYPQISLAGIEQVEAKRPVAHVEDADFNSMVEKLRGQSKTWTVAERAAQAQDRVTIHFSGVCEGENFTDGKVENFAVEIGANQMIPGFEEQLIGLQANDSKVLKSLFHKIMAMKN